MNHLQATTAHGLPSWPSLEASKCLLEEPKAKTSLQLPNGLCIGTLGLPMHRGCCGGAFGCGVGGFGVLMLGRGMVARLLPREAGLRGGAGMATRMPLS